MTACLTICDSCAFSPEEKLRDGLSGGAILAALVEARAAGLPGLAIRRHTCLMGCTRACNVALSAPGKITYVLGGFRPEPEAAAAILAYAALYAGSPTGQVPLRQWPAGVRGHFVARIPPLPGDPA